MQRRQIPMGAGETAGVGLTVAVRVDERLVASRTPISTIISVSCARNGRCDRRRLRKSNRRNQDG